MRALAVAALPRARAARAPLFASGRTFAGLAVNHGDRAPSGVVVPEWANVNPETLSGQDPHSVRNLCQGQWTSAAATVDIPDPLNGESFISMPDTKGAELQPFADAARSCPKSGRHNAFKNPERYVQYGEICHAAGAELSRPEVMDYMAKLISRVMPKSYFQSWYEVKVSADFLKNFGGDNPRFNAGGMHVSGDHLGQQSAGYRWPFGPVAIVAPFNFPLEIPSLQLMGALMMGNRPTLKAASTVSIIMEQYIRLLIHCGMPPEDMDFVNCGGRAMGQLIGGTLDSDNPSPFRLTQFTGSCEVAEDLAEQTNGKVRLEDAGYDWKILGPDVTDIDFVAWTADQDAYAASGQKCSAQSICFMHDNWVEAGIEGKLKALAARRSLDDLTIGPILSHSTEEMLAHMDRLLSIPGARLAFGGKELNGGDHATPAKYGMLEPTAVYVPLEEMLRPEHFPHCAKEIFGPFQVLTSYGDATLPLVLQACETMSHHLTAAVVSNDPRFQDAVLGSTVNGTTYTGIRARTTGAPQNHWFGPAGDPRGAGIGSPYAIQLVWSSHREIIRDHGAIPDGWAHPPPS